MRRLLLTFLAAASLASAQLKPAEPITQEHLLGHIRELSSDAYTGRAPGTEGDTKSVAYVIAQAKAIGLQPGNPDGSWTQTVKLWGMLPQQGTLQLRAKGKDMPLVAGMDYTAYTTQPKAKADVPSSGVVFVGYGVVAPEYKWDDYAGVDVHGKVVVILNGDPPVADPSDPSKLNESMFWARRSRITGALEQNWSRHTGTVRLQSSPSRPRQGQHPACSPITRARP